MQLATRIVKRGPVFDGRAVAASDQFLEEWGKETATEAWNTVQAKMDQRFRNPTGYYRSQVVTDRASSEDWRVHDNNVVYGPWLEGTGSRNATTRFKGYRHWRETVQEINNKARGIGEQVVGRFIARMRG